MNDYFQFRLGTVGFSRIGVSFDQTSSNTGPRDYDLTYSTDGVNFTLLASYSVLANASPNPTWSSGTYQSLFNFNYDLSSISALDNAADVYFRLVNTSTVSANGATVAAAGTSRLDNFTVYVVPEPTGLTLAALGFGLLLAAQRFIRRN